MNEEKKPREYDLVLGGNNPPPVDGVVLVGIEGVKRRFDKANSEEEQIINKKISILQDALQHGEAGKEWLFKIFREDIGVMQWIAAGFLSDIVNIIYQKKLDEYLSQHISRNEAGKKKR